MGRKLPVAYATMQLPTDAAPESRAETKTQFVDRIASRARNKTEADGTLKKNAAHVMLYLDPAFVRAIKRFALESGDGVKQHDIFVQWLQEGADRAGLNVTARVPSRDRDITD